MSGHTHAAGLRTSVDSCGRTVMRNVIMVVGQRCLGGSRWT